VKKQRKEFNEKRREEKRQRLEIKEGSKRECKKYK
jgi:hypothetical protein